MSKEKQAVLKIAGVFISTVIGAGFASGQEIVTFFIRYGRSGLLGLGVAGALFILYGWGILSCVYKNKIRTYSEFTDQIAGRQAGRVLSWIRDGLYATKLWHHAGRKRRDFAGAVWIVL